MTPMRLGPNVSKMAGDAI